MLIHTSQTILIKFLEWNARNTDTQFSPTKAGCQRHVSEWGDILRNKQNPWGFSIFLETKTRIVDFGKK